MIYRKVKRMAEEISVIGMGCWNFGGQWDNASEQNSIALVHRAIELGINFFDVAPVYGLGVSETVLGKALQGKRDQVLIASKGGLVWDDNGNVTNNLTKKSLLKEVDDSLRRLNTDYIDLYQMHWPDPNTDLMETAEALNEIRQSGKVKYIGLTNFSKADIETLMKVTEIDSQQALYNMLERNPKHYHNIPLVYRTEAEILPLVKEHGQAFLPYSPLFQGLLAGRFLQGKNFSESDVRNANPKLCGDAYTPYMEATQKLNDIAVEIGKPLNELAFNWLIANPQVTSIIAGASTIAQLEKNANSTSWSLDAETLAKIEVILAPFVNE